MSKTVEFQQMLEDNILIERDADDLSRQTEGGLYLPDVVSQNNTAEGTVIMVSDSVTCVKPGDRVLYHPSGAQDFHDGSKRALRIVRKMALVAVLKSEAVA